MNLDPKIAESIVTSLKNIINHEINLFDTTGTIIASTDRSRTGTNHEGASLVIRTMEPLVIDDEHRFRGARHGINLPVIFNDSVVAVIGITGEPEEVEPFGLVVKKMTEILIRENWNIIEQYDRRSRLTSLVNMLKLRHHDLELVAYYASVMQIDLGRPRVAVVGRVSPEQGEVVDYSPLYTTTSMRLQHLKTSFFAFTDREICLFVDEGSSHAVPALLEGIQQDAQRLLHRPIRFGIGMPAETSALYWRSYEEADRALSWLEFSGGDDFVSHYDGMDLGLVVSSIPEEGAQRLVDHVFGGLSSDEVDGFERVFVSYTNHNGSIVHSAEELYLHKNTLQNRLNKIADKTGYNPRELSGYAVLYMAFLLRRYLGRPDAAEVR